MSPLQLLIYGFLKILVRLFFRWYYPRTLVLGAEHLHISGPMLVVSNHPNTLIDGLNVAFRADKPLFFLANAGLFRNPLAARALHFLYSIPVERPQDVNGRPLNNEQAFAATTEHLSGGGSIFIAPEGGSEMERRLRPLRTGTARIAFQAEEKHGFDLGVRILPVGLTYAKPHRSGSALIVHAGAPILIREWESAYRQDSRQAVHALTQVLEQRLRELVLDTRDEAEDRLHGRLEEILTIAGDISLQESWVKGQRLLNALRDLGFRDPVAYRTLETQVQHYAKALENLGLEEASFSRVMLRDAAFALTLPVWVFAWVHHVPVVLGLRALARKVDLFIGYTTTLKWVGALAILPVWYGLLTLVIPVLVPAVPRMTYALALLASGCIFAAWRPGWKRLWTMAMGRMTSLINPGAWTEILETRRSILQEARKLLAPQRAV